MKFKDYLTTNFNTSIFEMAKGDVVAEPQLFDEDDIDFLKQFPDKFKPEALHQRYNFLNQMLKEREKLRKDKYNYEGLKKKFADQGNSAGTAHRHANFTVDKMAKDNNDVLVNEPSVMNFTFKDNKAKKIIKARPYINRLIAKLETEPGEPFNPAIKDQMDKIGMKTGKYGHDLEDGYNFSNTPNIHKKAFNNWMVNNAHGHYGELPDENWKQVNLDDDKAIEKLLAKASALVHPYEKELNGQDGKKKAKATLDKEIDDKAVELVQSGKADELLPQKAREMGAKFSIETSPSGPKIIAPKIFLPHKKSVDANGEEHEEAILSKPSVLKKVYDAEGNLSWQQSPTWRKGGEFDAGSGYNPNYSYAGKRHISKIDPRYAESKAKLDQVLAQNRANFSTFSKNGQTPSIKIIENRMHGEFFYDILKGIKQAIDNGEGGAGYHEKIKLVNLVEDLHQMILMQYYESLGTKLYSEDSEQGAMARTAKARSFTGAYAQKNIADRGSRRRREKDKEMGIGGGVQSLTSGDDDMDDSAVLDQITQKMVNRQELNPSQISNVQKTASQLAREADKLKNSFKKNQEEQDMDDSVAYRSQALHSLMLLLITQYEHIGMSETDARKKAADFSEKVSQNYNMSTEELTNLYNKEIDRLKSQSPNSGDQSAAANQIPVNNTEELENELDRVGKEIVNSSVWLDDNPNPSSQIVSIINGKLKEIETLWEKGRTAGIKMNTNVFERYKKIKNMLNPVAQAPVAQSNPAPAAASGQKTIPDFIKDNDWVELVKKLSNVSPMPKANLDNHLAKFNINLDTIVRNFNSHPHSAGAKYALDTLLRKVK